MRISGDSEQGPSSCLYVFEGFKGGDYYMSPPPLRTPPTPPGLKINVYGMGRRMPANPAAAKWAIRITTGIENEHRFSSIENMAIIHHTGGSRYGHFNEKSHYHIYYEGPEIRYNELKKVFTDLGFPMFGNPDYSMKAWSTLEDWWNYVWKHDEKDPRVILWGFDVEQPPIPVPVSNVPLVSSPTQFIEINDKTKIIMENKKPARKSSLEKQNNFLQFCIDNDVEPCHEEILYALYHWMRDLEGFMVETSTYIYVNYVMAKLTKDTESSWAIRERWKDRIIQKYF